MNVLAIDPGPTQSAIIGYCPENQAVHCHGLIENSQVLYRLDRLSPDHLAIEMIDCFGMAVGRDVFETVYWIGRFAERVTPACPFTRITRRKVKMNLCNSMQAKDKNIRQALLSRFPATGGGKTPQVGTKNSPGPLYGVSGHLWAALAVAVTWADMRELAEQGD